jgi:hypothetical protein
MFKQKNALIAVAVTVLLAACGGGGGGSDSSAAPANTTPGGGGATNTAPVVVADKDLAGQLTLSQVISNGVGYPLDSFEGKTTDNQGLYGQEQGASGSPVKTFGIKFLPEQTPTTGASGNGHVAIEVMDPAVGTPRKFQVAIDRVDYKVSTTSANTFEATVPSSAKTYVSVKSAGGTADVVLDTLPAGTVTVATGYTDDPSFRGLVIDLDKILAAAKVKATGDAAKTAALNAVKDFEGSFNMNGTFSALNIVRSGQATKYPGADITVSGQPVIKGQGVKGKLWIKTTPPGVSN